jgi:hypothetical protein
MVVKLPINTTDTTIKTPKVSDTSISSSKKEIKKADEAETNSKKNKIPLKKSII